MEAVIEAPKAKHQKMLDPQRIKLAEVVRRDWVFTAEVGTTVEDLKDPNFWALAALQLSQFDHVEVRMETGEWVAELMVAECERTWARMHLLQVHDFGGPSAEPASATGKYRVEWKGVHRKFAVIRNSDATVLKEGMSKADANLWMSNHERTAG
jgi:hypothetical protein